MLAELCLCYDPLTFKAPNTVNDYNLWDILCHLHSTNQTHTPSNPIAAIYHTSSHIWKLLALHFQGDTRGEHKSQLLLLQLQPFLNMWLTPGHLVMHDISSLMADMIEYQLGKQCTRWQKDQKCYLNGEKGKKHKLGVWIRRRVEMM